MNWSLLWAFIRKEMLQTLRDKRMRILLFVAPVLQMTLFGLALSNEVRNITLAVYAAPGDRLAWDLAQRSAASGLFRLVAAPHADPYVALRSGKVDAALVAPPGGMDHALGRGQARPQLLIDASNSVRGQGVANYMNSLVAQVVAERFAGSPEAPPRLQLEPRVLYNPSLESRRFMVPGILAMLLTLVTLTLTSTSITREKERGTFELLIAAPVSKAALLLGKAVPYILLGLVEMPLVLIVAHFGFQVPLLGPLWQLAVASLAFIISTVSLGVLLSSLASNQQQAMLGSFLILFPAQMLSGVIYPIENMPAAIYWITYLNPLRYFAILLRNIMLKGGDLTLFWPNVGALCVLGAGLFALAWRKFSQTLN